MVTRVSRSHGWPDRFLLVLILLGVIFPAVVYSLTFPGDETGDNAMADRYAVWLRNLMEDGYGEEALFALERAGDFADVSSDICYLLAMARAHQNRPRLTVLEALNMALSVDRWILYRQEDARLAKAEVLIALKAYPEASLELSRVSRSPREAVLNLKAAAAGRPWDFRRLVRETLDRHPRECEPVRIFFDFISKEAAAGRNPTEDDLDLLELIIRRLPILIQSDAELAWMAAPFLRDPEDGRRLIMAYRAVNTPSPESLPASLMLGAIDEEIALEELFGTLSGALDLALLDRVWTLLRLESSMAAFRRSLSEFSGFITEDSDNDGIPETQARYYRGMPDQCAYDIDQDGIPDLIIYFEAGNPVRALTLLPPDNASSQNFDRIASSVRKQVDILWEKYPAILEAELDQVRYIPWPLYLNFSPALFIDLWNSGVLFPQRDPLNPPITRRVLVSRSIRIERASREFQGGKEVVELSQGIPVRAREYVGDLMVSETDFLRGRPQLQRVDLDFDGRMETARFFSRNYRAMELEELWDYDREYSNVVTNWSDR